MTLGNRQRQVLEFVRDHPTCTTADITNGIFPATSRPWRLAKKNIANTVRGLEAKGLVLRATRLCSQSVKMSVWFLTEEGENALKGRSAA